MLGSLGWQELLIIFAILALLFGATRIADLGGALGRGIREFRTQARDGDKNDDEPRTTADIATPPAPEERKPS